MIPKLIHFCWLSTDDYPDDVKACMKSWKKFLPDYEFIHWNFDRFDVNSSAWVKQAFTAKKYAFAADYIRLYALYNFGGIYIDTDVEILKPFDDLITLPYIVGKEKSKYGIEAAVIGSEKGCEWIGRCLEHYKDREFETGIGRFDKQVLPSVVSNILNKYYKLNYLDQTSDFVLDNAVVNIFNDDFFSPKSHETKEISATKNTYCIHHFAGSWKKNEGYLEKMRSKLAWLKVNLLYGGKYED